jgi:hypothetical protein
MELKPYDYSPYVTSSLTRGWFCLVNMLGLSSSERISHIQHAIEQFLPFAIHTQVLSQYRLCKAADDYLGCLMLQRQLSHMNGRKLDHRQV